MVLVDSSVWISFFKGENSSHLDRLIEEDMVCTNELILTELLPLLHHKRETDVISALLALPIIPLQIDWELIRRYHVLNLANGLNHVGIPDLVILQQVIENHLSLFSFDNHFKKMAEHLNFDLLSS
jgi:hypothetical protein